MTRQPVPLVVRLLLPSALVTGSSRGIEGRRRFVDLLNAAEPHVDLEAVAIKTGNREVKLAHLSVEKRDIIAAVPQETEEQSRRRLIANVGGRIPTAQVPLFVLAPPYHIRGTAHPPTSSLVPGSVSLAGLALPRFFALTDATLESEGGSIPCDVVLVNRDHAAAIGRAES